MALTLKPFGQRLGTLLKHQLDPSASGTADTVLFPLLGAPARTNTSLRGYKPSTCGWKCTKWANIEVLGLLLLPGQVDCHFARDLNWELVAIFEI